MLPEVVFFAESYHMRWLNTDFFCPNFISLVIVFINRYIEFINRHFENLCKELPCPSCSLMLEIVTEREVTEHFKVCAVTGSNTYPLNIGSTNTFLAGCNTLSRWCNLACKVLFHRCHTTVDKQKAVVVLWNKRKARKS